MTRHVAFLRAINVAGHPSVKMTDVKAAFEAAGCLDVRTYIQSGNVLFTPPDPEAPIFERIRNRLAQLLEREPVILFRRLDQVRRLVERDPFRELRGESRIKPLKLYVVFLSRRPGRKPDLPLTRPREGLEAIAMRALEVFVVSRPKDNGFYGLPNNFIESELGVAATSRNWTTLSRIAALEDR